MRSRLPSPSDPSDYTPLSTNNLTDTGSHAVAQILRGQGVNVTQYDALARVAIADPSTTTLVIANGDSLTDAQIASVLDVQG